MQAMLLKPSCQLDGRTDGSKSNIRRPLARFIYARLIEQGPPYMKERICFLENSCWLVQASESISGAVALAAVLLVAICFFLTRDACIGRGFPIVL